MGTIMVVVNLTPDALHSALAWVLLYIGPDAFLPLTSALAALAGLALMFWNRVVGFARKLWLMVTRRPE